MGVAATLAPATTAAPRATALPPVAASAARVAALRTEAACDCGATSGFSGRCEACDRTSLKHRLTVDDGGHAAPGPMSASSLGHDLSGFRIHAGADPPGAASSQPVPLTRVGVTAADEARWAHSPHPAALAVVSPTVTPAPSGPRVEHTAPVGPQTMLVVSSPGDAAEQEALQISRHVAGMADPVAPGAINPVPAGAAPKIYRRATGDAAVTPDITLQLEQSRSAGTALPGPVRGFMEPRFGADFGGVRIHTGEPAAALSGQLGAQAFTVGRDIYFGRGQFQPGTTPGRELIAHELTHTIQQGGTPAPGITARAPPSIQRWSADDMATQDQNDPTVEPADPDRPDPRKARRYRLQNGRMVEAAPEPIAKDAARLKAEAAAAKQRSEKRPPPPPVPGAAKPVLGSETPEARTDQPGPKSAGPETIDAASKPPAKDEVPDAEAEGAKASPAAAQVVKLHVPEPPSGPSPATMRRISGVKARAGGKAAAQGALPAGAAQVGDARQAVTPPDAERAAAARAELIAQVQAAPSPEIVALCERIRDVIRNKRPPDEDALAEAKPDDAALDAGNQLNSSVQGETTKVQENYGTVNRDPAVPGTPAAPTIPPQPDAAATPPINAKGAVPDAVPAGDVSLDKDAADTRKKAEDAGMDTPAAKLVQSGPVAEARAAQGELDEAAQADPAKVLAAQKEALGKAETDMATLQGQALAALTVSREGAVKGDTSQQHSMVGSEESMREKAGADAKKAFDDAQTAVNGLLKDLPANAMSQWDAAKAVLVTQFKSDLAIVKQRVDDRHSGVGGFFLGLKDAVAGLPDWAEEAYSRAEKNFGDGVIEKLTKISTDVNAVIAACDLIIKGAKERITKIFADLPQSLQGWATQEQEKFDGQLGKLHNQVIAARDNFNKDLIERSSAAVDEVRTEIADLRKKAGGLVGRIVAAIGRFIDDPVKFIIEGLLEILGIPPAAFWAVIAKIKKVAADIVRDPLGFADNLLKGIGQGFSQFFDHFGTYLIKGFLTWLLGDLKGVQIPRDLSLKSIATFFLQLMGITWPNIRKILVDKIGAKNVALIEKVYSLVSLLIEKGPEGIYEMIKDKLDPQAIVDQVVDMAVDYMVTAIAKQVAVRLLMLFNPAGAIVEALEAIYRVLKWVFQNAAKIFRLVETVVNGMVDIIAGNIGGFANAVEQALGMLIPPVIGFIADYFSLGDLPGLVADKIKGMQQWILGLIEKAIVWIIEKGKALLEAVGLGKKEDKKDGDTDEGVGEKIEFEADDETHSLSVNVNNGAATLMVASDTKSLQAYLKEAAKNPDIASEVAKAQQLSAAADVDADYIAKTIVHQKSKKEEGINKDLSSNRQKLSAQEKELATLLKFIFSEMRPIQKYIGKSINSVKKAPYGYRLIDDEGIFEYRDKYAYTEIQRDAGFGSASEKLFPRVHVEGGLVTEGPGLYQSDNDVLLRYAEAIESVRARLDGDGAPNFTQSPDAPASGLKSSANKQRSFTIGIRKQMEAIVAVIEAERNSDTELTGVELRTGRKRVDFSLKRTVGRSEINAIVEYKHWTGYLPANVLAERTNSLERQLRGQIAGGKTAFTALIVQWPEFFSLSEKSRLAFYRVLERVRLYGEGVGVSVLLHTG